jgi:hypothetical protein
MTVKENEYEQHDVVQIILIMMEKMTEQIVRMEVNNEKDKVKDDIRPWSLLCLETG